MRVTTRTPCAFFGAEAATWVGSHICFYLPWTTSSGVAFNAELRRVSQ
jgi:hypothetical protein